MWKKMLCSLLAALMLLSCVACGGKTPENNTQNEVPVENTDPKENTEPAENTDPTENTDPENVVANPLTGLPLADPEMVNARPVAVMLNNHRAAQPQHGISDADILYEFLVEGGITRLMGVYQEPAQAGILGSVRSARACYIETAMGLDAIYAHCGSSAEGTEMMSRMGVDRIDGAAYEGSVYWRDMDRYKTMAWEHILMTSGENLSNFLAKSSMRRDHKEGYEYPITYVEDATPAGGEDAAHISVRFSSYKTALFDYDTATGLYMVSQYGTPHVDGNTGKQLGTTNVLVLRTSVVNSGDSSGHMNIDLKGTGSGYFFCGGKAEPITWSKQGTNDPFTYYHADGTALSLQAGHSYVCVIPLDANLSYGA